MGKNINLAIFLGESENNLAPIETEIIIEMMIIRLFKNFLAQPQLKKLADTVEDLSEEILGITFDKLYNTTNHMKLIQHQYKIPTLIATSKFMRYKMKISPTFNCAKCPHGSVETLEHIYVHCPKNIIFSKE
jgi:hypothetical protein